MSDQSGQSRSSKRPNSSPLTKDNEKKERHDMDIDIQDIVNNVPVMLIGVDEELSKNDPGKIKLILDEHYPNLKFKQVKVTSKGNLIIEFDNIEDLIKFTSGDAKIKFSKFVLLDKKEIKHEIVIKGITLKIAEQYFDELKKIRYHFC